MWRLKSAHHCNTLSNLFLLIARSLHAMSVGKKLSSNHDSTVVDEPAEPTLPNDMSPVCPVLTKSTMDLITKYKH